MPAGQLVNEAEAALREWLESYKAGADRRLPSERALAVQLGQKHYAVNRAMARLVGEGLVRREGYKLFRPPFRGKATRPLSCDLVVSQRSIHIPSFRKVAAELSIRLKIHPWQSAEEAVAILQHLNLEETECIVFDPPFGQPLSHWEPVAQHLARLGIPIVSISQLSPSISCVMADTSRALELIVDHLLELGHQEICLLTMSRWSASSDEILQQWKAVCEKKGLAKSASRIALQNHTRMLPEDAKDLAIRFTKDWNKVTALVTFPDNEYPAQLFVDEFHAVGVKIPEKLSLVFVGDSKNIQLCLPPISATSLDMPLMHEMAYLLALRSLRKKKETGVLPQPSFIRVQEKLILRKSTGPGPGHKQKRGPGFKMNPHLFTPLDDPGIGDVRTAWQKPYDLTAKAAKDRFVPLDLGAHVNRPLNFRRGWLGDLPLKQLRPGRHIIHGVPFQVLGGPDRADCGAIVFQSMLNTIGSARKLPAGLDIPINSQVKSVYILHGCGYAKFMHRFATYSFYHGKKKIGEVPLVTLGRPEPSIGDKELGQSIRKANIQDWWPDFPHYHFEHARMVPLLENEQQETAHRHVYLYTLEWVNPHPQTSVTHIRIASNPEQSTTLGVLAISLLLANSGGPAPGKKRLAPRQTA